MKQYTPIIPQSDQRIQELYALAASEGICLPMPADLIVFFECHGYIVDLHTGKVEKPPACEPTPMGRALEHLLRLVPEGVEL